MSSPASAISTSTVAAAFRSAAKALSSRRVASSTVAGRGALLTLQLDEDTPRVRARLLVFVSREIATYQRNRTTSGHQPIAACHTAFTAPRRTAHAVALEEGLHFCLPLLPEQVASQHPSAGPGEVRRFAPPRASRARGRAVLQKFSQGWLERRGIEGGRLAPEGAPELPPPFRAQTWRSGTANLCRVPGGRRALRAYRERRDTRPGSVCRSSERSSSWRSPP